MARVGSRSLPWTMSWALGLGSLCACNDAPPPTPPPARPDDVTAAVARTGCTFARGAMPFDTLGASEPLGSAIPIETIVVLAQENRSFDSYYSHLNQFAGRTDIESAPDSTTNPTADGGTAPFIHAPHLCVLDTNH